MMLDYPKSFVSQELGLFLIIDFFRKEYATYNEEAGLYF